MSDAFEVPEPILNSPFEEPADTGTSSRAKTPERRPGRRPAVYYYRDPESEARRHGETIGGNAR